MSKNQFRILSDSELPDYKTLGSGYGPSLAFCAAMGSHHVPNFMDRVSGCRIEELDEFGEMIEQSLVECGLKKEKYLKVTFYERL